MMLCWMNGKYMDANELMISPFDHGFLYGLGFFETLRTYEGKVVFLEEHYLRLCEGLKEYRIAMPYSVKEFADIIKRLNGQNEEDGYFRINVSAGVHDIGLAPTEYPSPTIIVFRKPLASAVRGKEKQARWLKTVRNTPEQAIRYKSHHYGNNVTARFELPNLVEYEGFFITEKGLVAEGITSNIFWAKDGILYTPSVDTGILAGITRQWVILLAEQLHIPVQEGFYVKEELEQADECFVTNSVQELVPISKLGNRRFAGEDGLIYEQLHRAYVAQILQAIGR